MNLKDCANTIFKMLDERFVEYDGTIRSKKHVNKYDQLDKTIQADKRRKLKTRISERLYLIFELMDDKMMDAIFEDFNFNELTLFVKLLKFIPSAKSINKNTKRDDACKKIKNARWESIPVKSRQSILNSVKAIIDDENTISRYLDITDKSIIQENYEEIEYRILHPIHYRLSKNIQQLGESVSGVSKDLDFEENSNIIAFENEFNNLLKKYYKKTDGIIKNFPRNHQELYNEIEKEEESFVKQLEEVLNNA